MNGRVTSRGPSLYHRAWRKTVLPMAERIRRRVYQLHLGQTVEHLHGPHQLGYGPNEVVATVVARNAEVHIDAFLEHHRAIGVKHVVLLDNGSTDSTVERAMRHERVSVLRTALPYSRYENAMKEYLSRRYCEGRWNLCLDVDELWEYPGRDRLPLSGFLDYLNTHDLNAVVCQMLDMFCGTPMARLASKPGEDLKGTYAYYDITALARAPYRYGTPPPGHSLEIHSRGIRWTLFGTPNMLTKAALVRIDPGVKLFVDWHHAHGVRLADVTCLLRHYPFTGGFPEKSRHAAATGHYGPSATSEYRRYHKVLESRPHLSPMSPTARRLECCEQLLDERFLTASPRYLAWVDRFGSDPT